MEEFPQQAQERGIFGYFNCYMRVLARREEWEGVKFAGTDWGTQHRKHLSETAEILKKSNTRAEAAPFYFHSSSHQWDESRPPRGAQLSHTCGREWGLAYPGEPLLQGKTNPSGRKRKCFKQSVPSPLPMLPHHFETLMASSLKKVNLSKVTDKNYCRSPP